MPLDSDALAALADAALGVAAGCQAAELRVERIRSQTVRLHDAEPETTADSTDFGMGVRVVVDGAVGFAATVDVRTAEAADLARRAMAMARVTSRAGGGRVELAPEPSHGDVTWSSAFEVNPTEVPAAEKIALLAEWSRRLGGILGAGAARPRRRCWPCRRRPIWPTSTARGRRNTAVRLQTQLDALGLNDGGFESMRRLCAARGRGWEFLTGPGGDGNFGTGTPRWPSNPNCWRRKCRSDRRVRRIRPRRRPDEPVADHPRVDRARHRARPRCRLRSGLRRYGALRRSTDSGRCNTGRRS